MNTNIKKEAENKKYLFKTLLILVVIAAVFGLFVYVYNYNSHRTQSYKGSEAFVNKVVSQQLGKNQRELTSRDYEQIESIVIDSNLVAGNVKPLLKLKNLKTIKFDISSATHIDLKPLEKLKKLKKLEFVFPGIIPEKRSWYENLRYKILSSDGTSLIYLLIPFDFNQLEKFKNLESLKVITPYASNIEALAGLTNLKYLEIDTNKWRIHDLRPFSGLVNLEFLSLRGQTLLLKDCNSISNLKKLNKLSIPSARIYNLDGLDSLENLQELNLSNTEITDANALQKLTGLKSVNLTNVPLSDEQIEELQRALPELKIVK